jgi:S-DNA-T family DNA segregation ATPase FtsK/SpoIIIE
LAQAHRIKTEKPAIRLGIFRFIQALARELGFWLLVVVALAMIGALASFSSEDPAWTHTAKVARFHNLGGVIGAWFADISLYFFGYAAYLLPLGVAFVGWRLFKRGTLLELDGEIVLFRVLGFLVTLATACGLATLHLSAMPGTLPGTGSSGGLVGVHVSQFLIQAFEVVGGNLFMALLLLAGVVLTTGFSWLTLLDWIGLAVLKILDWVGGLAMAPLRWMWSRTAGGEDAHRQVAIAAGPPETPAVPSEVDEPPPVAGRPATRVEPVLNLALDHSPLEPSIAASASASSADRQPPSALDLRTLLPAKPPATVESQPAIPQPVAALAGAAPGPGLPARGLGWTAAASNDPLAVAMTLPPLPGASPVPRVVSEMDFEAEEGDPDADDASMPGFPSDLTVVPSPASTSQPPVPARAPVAGKAAVMVRRLASPLPAAPYPLPPLALLDPPVAGVAGYSPETLDHMSRRVEILLRHFGIAVKVVAVEPGPVITRFEIEPAPGVKVSQISNLAKDLARGLSVISVRVVEIIPGKSVIGLEIPNQQREIVYLREVLESPIYTQSVSPLTLSLGKDISGNPVVANLAKMPHLLVAGTTGSGKSVAINAMLLSLLYKASPQEVRLILVDPKMLELSMYEDIPHLLTPVVTDMKEAANALRWCVGEMERRYRLMAALKVRNIAGFNRKLADAQAAGEAVTDPFWKPGEGGIAGEIPLLQPLPFIVVVIDELADMMMIVGKKVEELIARLAQKARAAGIHLILATQRPSVDVITGLIKANIPTRIAFQVSSRVDSRTILDQMGAEQLLGHGDMLYLPPGTGLPQRVHGAFVDDHEVPRVVDYLRQTGTPDYIDDVLAEPREETSGAEDADDGGRGGESDPLYDEAVRIVTESRRASVSGVQRRLRIGYNRAARLVEEMEVAGIVGPVQTNGNREVLAPPPP